MLKRNNLVKNPLSIFILMIGVIETIAVSSLKIVNLELQYILVWFIVGFPILLVLLFFIILVIKPTSLYAPSDYKDERNFLITVQESRIKTKVEKRK